MICFFTVGRSVNFSMTVVKVYSLDDNDLKEPLRSFAKGDHVIGRGELKCNDKRVSRRHAIISVTDDFAELKAIHINPCFYKSSSGKSIEILSQNTTKELHDGDTFALLADKFWFRVKLMSGNDRVDDECELLSKRNHNDKQESSNKRVKIDATPHIRLVDTQKLLENIQHISEDYPNTLNGQNAELNESVDFLDFTQTRENEWGSNSSTNVTANAESQNVQQDQTVAVAKHKLAATKVSNSEGEATSNPENIRQIIEEDAMEETCIAEKSYSDPEPVSIKKEPKEEANVGLKTELCQSESATVNKEQKGEPSEYNSIGTSSSSAASSSGTLDKPKTVRRDRCWYGASCYRKNPIHRQDVSHPGDPDYVSDPDDDRPSCPFGNACYRTNMDHRRQYKHSAKPAPKPSSTVQKKASNRNEMQSSSCQDIDEGTESEDYSQPTKITQREKRKSVKKEKKFNETSEDDYDLEDPFIDDASSDAFEPSDDGDESDWDDEVESADETEDIKRLVKEAKRFTKKNDKKVTKWDQIGKEKLSEEEDTVKDLKKAQVDSDETDDQRSRSR